MTDADAAHSGDTAAWQAADAIAVWVIAAGFLAASRWLVPASFPEAD